MPRVSHGTWDLAGGAIAPGAGYATAGRTPVAISPKTNAATASR